MSTLDELLDAVTVSAFRWEGHMSYAVGGAEADRIEAWRAGQPRPVRSVRTNAYLARIAAKTLGGVQWRRVRVVSDPPTEYQRYRIPGDQETQAVGEEVRILPAGAAGPAVGTVEDFWLLDHGTPGACAVVLRYTDDGRFDGLTVDRRPVVLDELAEFRDRVLEVAVPLNEFLARSVAGV